MQPCNTQVPWSWILITGLYLWLNPQYMHYEDILEAVQLGSTTEVMNCLIFCLVPQKGTQQKKFSIGLVYFGTFPCRH